MEATGRLWHDDLKLPGIPVYSATTFAVYYLLRYNAPVIAQE